MKKSALIFGILIFVFINVVSAEILISQPERIYNLGDNLNVDITLRPNAEINDFLTSNLICGENNFGIYKNYFSLNSGEQKKVNINFMLNSEFVSGNESDCFIKATYENEFAESQNFEITNKILVSANIVKKIYEPGEKVEVSGTAKEVNNKNFEGLFELKINSLDISIGGIVSKGIFNASFKVPSNYSGEYIMELQAYDKNNNEGHTTKNFEIRPILTEIKIDVESDKIVPSENISYIAKLVDQAGNEMIGDIAIEIDKPDNSEFLKEVKGSGERNIINTKPNFSAGYWKIKAVSGEIKNIKLIYIEEKKNVQFDLTNNTLVVSNMGNVPFFGPIEFLIGSNKEVKQIKLKIGETKKFRLSAPDGDYQIGINDGNKEVGLGTVNLAGKTISIDETGQGIVAIIGNRFFAWILLILIIGGSVSLFVLKKKGISVFSKFKKYKIKKHPNKKTNSIISSGRRHNAGIILLKIDTKLDKQNSKIIKKTIEFAKVNKAGVNNDEENRIILFTPLLTKCNENDFLALKVAKGIEEILQEYNRRHANKIKYGIGVHTGEIIAESREKKLKFISVGNIISLTKRISSEAKNEILVSDIIHRKLINKANFKKTSGKDYWKVERLKEKNKEYEKFVKEFILRRTKEIGRNER